jgi:hypothetical protein
MRAFHGVLLGVDLTDDADDLFNGGEPWTVASGEQPDPNEGHVVVKVGSDGREYDTDVTWGALQRATLAWSRACVQECWAIITSEDEINPAALAAMRADIDALGGHDIPPSPAPSPSPQPSPESLLAEVAGLIRSGAAAAKQDWTELVAFLASHGL